MAKFKIMLYKSNQKKDGSYPICLRVAKQDKVKYICLGMSANLNQWNEDGQRFKKDKRINPEHEKHNALLNIFEERIDEVLRNFAECRINWTLNQFEEKFVGLARQGKVCDYIRKQLDLLKSTNHFGTLIIFSTLLNALHKYDSRIENKVFAEIDYTYVCRLNAAMERDRLAGNTRLSYMRALRTIINKAIRDKEAPQDTYPFGKGGFSVTSLAETTSKRYLLKEDLDKIKGTVMDKRCLEEARRLFLFSYYCFGMSFVDMANLTTDNMATLSDGNYIIYKRQKTKTHKAAREIKIHITPNIQELLDWFHTNSSLIGDYLLPIVNMDCQGYELHHHILCRYGTYRMRYAALGEKLGLKRHLTTYVSRHTMAMTLQSNLVPREIISQAMGHKNLATTNIYLDSFNTSAINSAGNLL